MYKKIKNGSFMNLFWFIVCLLPIIYIILYSLSFYNYENKDFSITDTYTRVVYANETGTDLVPGVFIEYTKYYANDYDYIPNATYYFDIDNLYTDFQTEVVEPLTYTNYDEWKNELYFFSKNENYYITKNYSFTEFLNEIYNSFASNGFINSTLLQVINYFNVNNVYMQLAILYIEYFIIIQLLHLFVDFMLLIPNICHKFMEKVGGERD